MTTLGAIPRPELAAALGQRGIHVRFGPFVHRIRSNADAIAGHLHEIYPDHEVASDDCAESTLTVHLSRDRRRPWRRTSRLYIDELPFMYPLSADFCIPMLEWSMNWVVATRAHQYLLCHSAVVERNGKAVILPAVSGSGKSTLCAMLVAAGWRLFSDEFAVAHIADSSLVPMPRAISLKNQSIGLVQSRTPHAAFTRSFDHKIKGTLAFMRAPSDAVRRSDEAAKPGAIVFPRYDAQVSIDASRVGQAETFREFLMHCMNYAALGERGFRCLSDMIDCVPAYKLRYGDNEEALAWFDQLAAEF